MFYVLKRENTRYHEINASASIVAASFPVFAINEKFNTLDDRCYSVLTCYEKIDLIIYKAVC